MSVTEQNATEERNSKLLNEISKEKKTLSREEERALKIDVLLEALHNVSKDYAGGETMPHAIMSPREKRDIYKPAKKLLEERLKERNAQPIELRLTEVERYFKEIGTPLTRDHRKGSAGGTIYTGLKLEFVNFYNTYVHLKEGYGREGSPEVKAVSMLTRIK